MLSDVLHIGVLKMLTTCAPACLRTVATWSAASPLRLTSPICRIWSPLWSRLSLSAMPPAPESPPLVSLDECRRFITDCLLAVKTPKPNAQALANHLVEADYRGHYSHGINRIEFYLTEIQNGICKTDAIPEILKEKPATAWVDGHNGLGVVVGNFCMDLAIKKARELGVGLVVAKGSNHFGMAGLYGVRAANKGLVGLSFTNGSPVMVPTRAKSAALGTNPLSVAAPAFNRFVLDMSTSSVGYGKLEMEKKQEGVAPPQWSGAEKKLRYPLGGTEELSSFKGYGLAVMVEILSGILGGAAYGPKIRGPSDFSKEANLGHCFIAIDPKFFAPGFKERLTDLTQVLRQMSPVDSKKPVFIPGDMQRHHMKAVDSAGGIRYVSKQLTICKKIADDLKVKPLTPLTT